LKPSLGKAYIGRAKLLAGKGLFEKAAADISVIIKDVKGDAGLYILRGGYYFKNADYTAALSDFLQAIALKPNNPDYYNEAANTYTEQGNTTAADALFVKGFTVAGMDTQTLQCYYGKFLVGQKRFAEAVAQYQKAFAGNPANLYSDDYNNAAIASYKTNDLVNAERYADIAIKSDPDCVNCYLNGASVAIDKQDWSKLLTLARAALKLAPENPNVNMLMAVGLTRTGSAEEGKQYENKAKALSAKN
ncbi:MAG: tetratricopeptide repeat protein, partial [Mucilaginibacter sp.]